MKTFRYIHADGSTSDDLTTMTVSELRDFLKDFPDEMPCLATWEGIYTAIREKRANGKWPDERYIKVATPDNSGWHPDDNVSCLIFDVDQH